MDQLSEVKLKSFWEKPEGKTGIIASALLVGGGVIGFIKALPWLIMVAQNTLHLIGLLSAIGAILFLITNKQVRTNASILFQIIMRKITSLIIKIDPLEILKIQVREMEDNLEKVAQSLMRLKETMSRLQRRIQQNEATVEKSMEIASYAKQKGQADQVFLSTRKAGRLQKSNMTLKDLFTRIETMYRVLSKVHQNCAVIIADTKDELQTTQEEWRAVKEAHGAMKSAMSIINGNKDRRAMYEEAYELLSNDIANKSGELEQMLEMSESLMNSIDLQNGVLQEQGVKMLEEWEKKADSWLLSSTKKSDAVSNVSGKPIEHGKVTLDEVAQETNNQFNNLFKKVKE